MKTSSLEFPLKNGPLAFVCKLSSGANHQQTLCGVLLDFGIPQGTARARFDKNIRTAIKQTPLPYVAQSFGANASARTLDRSESLRSELISLARVICCSIRSMR